MSCGRFVTMQGTWDLRAQHLAFSLFAIIYLMVNENILAQTQMKTGMTYLKIQLPSGGMSINIRQGLVWECHSERHGEESCKCKAHELELALLTNAAKYEGQVQISLQIALEKLFTKLHFRGQIPTTSSMGIPSKLILFPTSCAFHFHQNARKEEQYST